MSLLGSEAYTGGKPPAGDAYLSTGHSGAVLTTQRSKNEAAQTREFTGAWVIALMLRFVFFIRRRRWVIHDTRTQEESDSTGQLGLYVRRRLRYSFRELLQQPTLIDQAIDWEDPTYKNTCKRCSQQNFKRHTCRGMSHPPEEPYRHYTDAAYCNHCLGVFFTSKDFSRHTYVCYHHALKTNQIPNIYTRFREDGPIRTSGCPIEGCDFEQHIFSVWSTHIILHAWAHAAKLPDLKIRRVYLGRMADWKYIQSTGELVPPNRIRRALGTALNGLKSRGEFMEWNPCYQYFRPSGWPHVAGYLQTFPEWTVEQLEPLHEYNEVELLEEHAAIVHNMLNGLSSRTDQERRIKAKAWIEAGDVPANDNAEHAPPREKRAWETPTGYTPQQKRACLKDHFNRLMSPAEQQESSVKGRVGLPTIADETAVTATDEKHDGDSKTEDSSRSSTLTEEDKEEILAIARKITVYERKAEEATKTPPAQTVRSKKITERKEDTEVMKSPHTPVMTATMKPRSSTTSSSRGRGSRLQEMLQMLKPGGLQDKAQSVMTSKASSDDEILASEIDEPEIEISPTEESGLLEFASDEEEVVKGDDPDKLKKRKNIARGSAQKRSRSRSPRKKDQMDHDVQEEEAHTKLRKFVIPKRSRKLENEDVNQHQEKKRSEEELKQHDSKRRAAYDAKVLYPNWAGNQPAWRPKPRGMASWTRWRGNDDDDGGYQSKMGRWRRREGGEGSPYARRGEVGPDSRYRRHTSPQRRHCTSWSPKSRYQRHNGPSLSPSSPADQRHTTVSGAKHSTSRTSSELLKPEVRRERGRIFVDGVEHRLDLRMPGQAPIPWGAVPYCAVRERSVARQVNLFSPQLTPTYTGVVMDSLQHKMVKTMSVYGELRNDMRQWVIVFDNGGCCDAAYLPNGGLPPGKFRGCNTMIQLFKRRPDPEVAGVIYARGAVWKSKFTLLRYYNDGDPQSGKDRPASVAMADCE